MILGTGLYALKGDISSISKTDWYSVLYPDLTSMPLLKTMITRTVSYLLYYFIYYFVMPLSLKATAKVQQKSIGCILFAKKFLNIYFNAQKGSDVAAALAAVKQRGMDTSSRSLRR